MAVDMVTVFSTLTGAYIMGWGAGFTIHAVKTFLEKI